MNSIEFTLITYKAITALILVALTASTGATAIYFNQKNTELNAKLNSSDTLLDNINGQLTNLNSQVSQLNNQNIELTSRNTDLAHQIEQLQAQLLNLTDKNTQLTQQIAQLQSQLLNLTTTQLQYEATPIMNGVVTLGGGVPQYVSFTVPSAQTTVKLNITAYMSATPGGNQIISFSIKLVNQTQYDSFQPWSNSSATWASPQTTSITTQLTIPTSGSWYLAFESAPGWGSQQNLTVTVTLLTKRI